MPGQAKARLAGKLATQPRLVIGRDQAGIVKDGVTADWNICLCSQALDGALHGGEGARDAAMGVMRGRIRPVERNVNALQILHSPHVEIGPVNHRACFTSHFHVGEESYCVVNQLCRLRVGEEVSPYEAKPSWAVGSSLDQSCPYATSGLVGILSVEGGNLFITAR